MRLNIANFNLGEVRTGVEAKVNNNLSLWGNVGVQLGDKGYSDTQGMLGVKYKAFKASLLSAIADISAFIPYSG